MRCMSYHGVMLSRPVSARPARRRASPRVDHETLADLRYHIRRFLRVREEAARAAGVALTECLQIRHHGTVQLIDRLAQRGMVRRRRAKLDRCGVVVELTARGEAVLHKLALNSLTELGTAGPALAATLTRVIELDGADRPRTPKSKEARDS